MTTARHRAACARTSRTAPRSRVCARRSRAPRFHGVTAVHERVTPPWRFANGAAVLAHHFLDLGFADAWRDVAGDAKRNARHLPAAELAAGGGVTLSVPLAVVIATQRARPAARVVRGSAEQLRQRERGRDPRALRRSAVCSLPLHRVRAREVPLHPSEETDSADERTRPT